MKKKHSFMSKLIWKWNVNTGSCQCCDTWCPIRMAGQKHMIIVMVTALKLRDLYIYIEREREKKREIRKSKVPCAQTMYKCGGKMWYSANIDVIILIWINIYIYIYSLQTGYLQTTGKPMSITVAELSKYLLPTSQILYSNLKNKVCMLNS